LSHGAACAHNSYSHFYLFCFLRDKDKSSFQEKQLTVKNYLSLFKYSSHKEEIPKTACGSMLPFHSWDIPLSPENHTGEADFGRMG
jgi:hypothetical protein